MNETLVESATNSIDESTLEFPIENIGRSNYKEEAQKYHNEVVIPKYDKLLSEAKEKLEMYQGNPPLLEMDKFFSIIDTKNGKFIHHHYDNSYMGMKHISFIKSETGGEPQLYEGRIEEKPCWGYGKEKTFAIKPSRPAMLIRGYGTELFSPRVDYKSAVIKIELTSGKIHEIYVPQCLLDGAFNMIRGAWIGD